MANFVHFSVLGFYVGSVGASSGVFTGENMQVGWVSSSKSNLATGKICGDGNRITGGKQEILDPDWLDTFVEKKTVGADGKAIPHPFPFPQSRRSTPRPRRMDDADWD